MNWGVPMAAPVAVWAVPSAATAMPKSMTRGPSAASSTFDGLRSRWTIPAPWMAWSASATPAISHSTAGTGSGPLRSTACVREGPGTYSVASQGGTPSPSASISSAVYAPFTRRAALISRLKRRRKPGSSASSGRTTLIATGRPPWVCERYTRPMPPAPSRAASRYPPTMGGSSVWSGWKASVAWVIGPLPLDPMR